MELVERRKSITAGGEWDNEAVMVTVIYSYRIVMLDFKKRLGHRCASISLAVLRSLRLQPAEGSGVLDFFFSPQTTGILSISFCIFLWRLMFLQQSVYLQKCKVDICLIASLFWMSPSWLLKWSCCDSHWCMVGHSGSSNLTVIYIKGFFSVFVFLIKRLLLLLLLVTGSCRNEIQGVSRVLTSNKDQC